VISVLLSRRAFLAGTCSALGYATVASGESLSKPYDGTIWDSLVNAIAGPVELSPPLRISVTRDFEAKYGLPAMQSLVAHFGHNGIFSVLNPQSEPIETQVQWITSYLFTGSADPSDGKARMINYPYALGWKSLRFAKAPGLCSGPDFGYWLRPWEAV
jgi:hypothetical protein